MGTAVFQQKPKNVSSGFMKALLAFYYIRWLTFTLIFRLRLAWLHRTVWIISFKKWSLFPPRGTCRCERSLVIGSVIGLHDSLLNMANVPRLSLIIYYWLHVSGAIMKKSGFATFKFFVDMTLVFLKIL